MAHKHQPNRRSRPRSTPPIEPDPCIATASSPTASEEPGPKPGHRAKLVSSEHSLEAPQGPETIAKQQTKAQWPARRLRAGSGRSADEGEQREET